MQRLMQFDATAEQVAKLEKRINFEIKQRQDTNRALQSVCCIFLTFSLSPFLYFPLFPLFPLFSFISLIN
jgi:hypothetical protein